MVYCKFFLMYLIEFLFFFLLFGEEMILFYDVVLELFENMSRDVKVYIKEFLENLKVYDKIVKENKCWY